MSPIYITPKNDALTGNPIVGISTLIEFNSSAVLAVPILGSIRTMRDFIEGPSILVPEIQDATFVVLSETADGGVGISRQWLDNKTTTQMSFVPQDGNASTRVNKGFLELEAGTYQFSAQFDYPQLDQLSATDVLNPQSQDLITEMSDQTTSLSFLSYTDKLLAGAWRFLTYFGRDSMIALLLMQPVLSEGQGGAVEAVIGAVLERLNKTDGKVAHEETIGDYATYQNLLLNISSTKPSCTYQMVDTDFYLPEVMENYFVKSATGRSRRDAFFAQKATTDFGNRGLTYEELALLQAQKVMRSTAPFAAPGGQNESNLIHLEEDEIVGEWRDSTYGIGGGRIPYDVNTGLVPAALRSIAALSAAGFYPEHPEWETMAAEYAQVWEDNTLRFFEVTIPAAEARALVENYAFTADKGFPAEAQAITSDVVYHGLALNGYDNQAVVKVMNTDDCFRHFLVNATNESQLTSFLNRTATNIRQPFPVGLSTNVGLLIANPAYGGIPAYAANWTNNAYHGPVVWSWQMSMMAAGFERQLARCSILGDVPDFCSDEAVYDNVLVAYNHLWDLIEANSQYLSSEVWSWQYQDGAFEFIDLGALPPPPGLTPTESDIRQLWSLTYLAVTRDESLR